jgi:hypothetical protein
MTFLSTILSIFLLTNAQNASAICLADCKMDGDERVCTFTVSRDVFSGELGYYTFEGGGGDCSGTNPTLGMEKQVTYIFRQKDSANYYHALGFAYAADGALLDNPELEPGISGIGDIMNACESAMTCPAPMYMKDGKYLGVYSNNEFISSPAVGGEDFGIDAYEPEFFYPLYDWLGAGEYKVALKFDTNYDKDIFYFCHIHQGMTGRIKFVDSNGTPLFSADEPEIPYSYQVPSAYDQSCGTFGLEEFQLPNDQCPKKFVCDRPGGKVGEFAECIDSMNCAMLVGMTTNVNNDNALGLFSHQMIPHHQNAVNMCKSLLKSGEAECANLEDEDDPACVVNVICEEIINVQNAQIQTLMGILEQLDLAPSDDCVVEVSKKDEKKKKKKQNNKKKKSA